VRFVINHKLRDGAKAIINREIKKPLDFQCWISTYTLGLRRSRRSGGMVGLPSRAPNRARSLRLLKEHHSTHRITSPLEIKIPTLISTLENQATTTLEAQSIIILSVWVNSLRRRRD
jgi:hypothetical protein